MLTSLVLAVSLVGQAPEMPSNYEHLQGLEFLIGDWEAEVVAPESTPAYNKGDILLWAASYKWALNKNMMSVDVAVRNKAGNLTLFDMKGMIGWDAGKKTIIGTGFNSIGGHVSDKYTVQKGPPIRRQSRRSKAEGGHERQTYIVRKGTVRRQSRGNEADGTETAATVIISDMTQKSFVISVVNRKRGDKDLPDLDIVAKQAKQ